MSKFKPESFVMENIRMRVHVDNARHGGDVKTDHVAFGLLELNDSCIRDIESLAEEWNMSAGEIIHRAVSDLKHEHRNKKLLGRR